MRGALRAAYWTPRVPIVVVVVVVVRQGPWLVYSKTSRGSPEGMSHS